MSGKEKKTKLPRCRTCGKPIRIPKGWSRGSAIRKHYWSKHRDVMLGPGGKS